MNPAETSMEPGSDTLKEILSQPRCWNECLELLTASPEFSAATQVAKPGAEWIFIGCGSSYYIAIAATATFKHLGLTARAVPASEILLYPELSIPKSGDYVPVLISRSGLTSEVLRAGRVLRERKLPSIAITCADGQPIETIASVTLKLLPADERSTVMTRSFTSMLLGLQYLAATVSGSGQFAEGLQRMPDQVQPLLEDTPSRLQRFVESREIADYVCLGQGPLFGIANEAMLKITESSCSYAQVFHSMEFRHGPKSIAGPSTLIAFFLSESSYAAEVEVVEEMKTLGSPTLVVANRLDERGRGAADFAVELGLETPEFARPAAYLIWAQLCAAFTGLKKGLNPDSPKNLSRVVVLDGQH
jgi:glucosamine--fructose-6-phosphate aminotransferase (isomerizing)